MCRCEVGSATVRPGSAGVVCSAEAWSGRSGPLVRGALCSGSLRQEWRGVLVRVTVGLVVGVVLVRSGR